jgi:uncharacterized protein YprB with RNaseH-like and TPR domain
MRTHVIVDVETAAIDDADQYIEPVEAPGNYKDPIKIAEYIAGAQAKAKDRCGLDPDLCRIVALGWMYASDDTPKVRLCKTVVEERAALEQFWTDVTAGDVSFVTFNGIKFDLPVLLRRSLYLHVQAPALNLDRYRTPHVDLLAKLTYNGVLAAHSLRFYLSRFGIAIDDLTTGKDIADLVREERWEDIAAHNRADVLGTRALALRINALSRPREYAEVG